MVIGAKPVSASGMENWAKFEKACREKYGGGLDKRGRRHLFVLRY